MKYRLKKDLPFAKAGSPILDLEGRPLSPPYTDCFVKMESLYGINYSHHDSGRIFIGQRHLLQDWIEEVKSRELRVHFGYAGGIIAVYEQSPTADICLYKSGIIPFEDKGNVFREVIE